MSATTTSRAAAAAGPVRQPGQTTTVEELAERAADAVRALTHLTGPGGSAPADPAQASDILAALCCLTHRLPPLLEQLAGWLAGQDQAGRLRVDTWSPDPDPAAVAAAAADSLAAASRCAQHAGHALDTAHQHLAHLAATDHHPDPDNDERGPR